MNDEFDLERFITAQDSVYAETLSRLRHGTMDAHYVDFIFPRLADCGPEAETNRFAISEIDEARAYLALPQLGDRYRECVEALTWLVYSAADEVFGEIGARKLHASLTLFAEATSDSLFRTVLAVWFDSRVDESTIVRLDRVFWPTSSKR